LEQPARIGRFVVLRKLGEGGMGVVYAAYDEELERRLAVKLLLPGLQSERHSHGEVRLLREAQSLAKVSHPNVVQVYEVGTTPEGVYIAMELVRGKSLGEWLAAASEALARGGGGVSSGGRGAGRGARGGGGASRREAGQFVGRRRRAGAGAGLQPGAAAGADAGRRLEDTEGHAAHADGGADRDAAVHVAGAAARASGGREVGSVQLLRDAV
jgi:hypothetical protein